MLSEEHKNKLDAVWKGEKCIICQFVLDQREFEDVVETENGFAHQDCLSSEEERLSEETNEKLEI